MLKIRPAVLLLPAILMLLLTACSGDEKTASPAPPTASTLTPRPRESGTPSPPMSETATERATTTPAANATPADILQQFLDLWRDARYSDMYDLLSTPAKGTISRNDFVKRYGGIADEAGIVSVKGAVTGQDRSAQLQSYSVTITTRVFGDITETNAVTLGREDRWRIDWNPS